MTSAENKKGGNKRGLIIAFIIILLAVNGVQLWLNLSKDQEIEKKDITIEEQKTIINNKTEEFDKVLAELNQKKAELAALGEDTARLSQEIARLTTERNKYAKEARLTKEKYKDLELALEQANLLRNKADERVKYLEDLNTIISQENRELKVKQEKFIDSLKRLNLTKEQLAEKVAIASVLKAENLRFEAISSKGKAKEGTEFRAKSLEKIRVVFNIADNKIAKFENKEIYLRIIEPDGSALFDMATGGGSFVAEGKEIPYTLKTDLLFDNKRQEVGFVYMKGSPYKPGKHTVELYCEGFNIGTGSFIVKK
jgi:cell division protein ZapB